jgi:hypothetical protein
MDDTIGSDKIFVGRCPTDKFDNTDLSLDVIIALVSEQINSVEKGASPKEHYENYCAVLKAKFGQSEPYHICKELSGLARDKTIEKIYDSIPYKVEEFRRRIETLANFNVSDLDRKNIYSLGSLFPKKTEEHRAICYFLVLKIFKLAEVLEIIPAYMNVELGLNHTERFFFLKSSSFNATLEYMQEKFILTKVEIRNIIEKEKSKI